MADQTDIYDAPACPLLGLATDRRSHHTYPHRDHRCHAKGRPAGLDVARQSTLCLSPDFVSCERFRAWAGPGWTPAATNRPTVAAGPVIVHMTRDRDSLARLADRFGISVEMLAAANDLAPDAEISPGQRIRIPITTTPLDPGQLGRPDAGRVG